MIATRRGKLGVLTRKRNEIDSLIKAEESKDTISKHLESFNTFFAEFTDIHVSVQSLLNEDEKETDQYDWYIPKYLNIRAFLDRTQTWMNDGQDAPGDELNASSIGPHDSVSQVSKKASDKATSKAAGKASSKTSSKASSKASDGVSKASSKKSKVSNASVAHIQAEVERAALKAKAQALEEKHALEVEAAQLKARKETLAVKTELAIADAKIQVFASLQEQQGQDSKSHVSESITSSSGTSTEYIAPATVQKSQTTKKVSLSPHSLPPHNPPPPLAPQEETKSKSPKQSYNKGDSADFDSSALAQVMRKQNEITEMLVKQQKWSLLPSIEIPIFDGDPLKFRSFINAFEQGIETKTDSMQDRLYYLEQFTTGQPKNLVRSFLHMDPYVGYNEAKRQLEWNFGNIIKVTSAFMDKALNWSVLKGDDGPALRSYAFFLRSCYNTMQSADIEAELENSTNMRILVSKLPFGLREKWRMVVCNIRERHDCKARFNDILEFLEKQARAALDPIFGETQNQKERMSYKALKSTPKFSYKTKGSSFATSVTPVSEQANSKLKLDHSHAGEIRNASEKQCLFCDKDHSMEMCDAFKQKPNKDKVDFIKAKGLCFGCLRKGHMSKSCPKRMSCQTCYKNHPTVLHIESKENPRQSQMIKLESKESSMSSALISLDAESHTGAGSKECALSVVPVKVKLDKGSKTVQTYAFLDPGSSATFCTEALMAQLNATGKKVEILLKTMGQERPVTSYKLSGLEVAALKENTYLKLPDVYTQKSIPVTKDNIPKKEDLRKWPYLRDVDLTPIDASIGLLIGVNAPKALEPWRIINSEGSGPYAVKTRLGWVINGPLSQSMDGDGYDTTSVQVNRISISDLEELFVRQYNQDFVEQHCDEHTEMSVEDKQFMDIMSASAVLKDEHYYLKLPFRKSDVRMPNNKQVAQQRAQYLLRRFKRDQSFFAEYRDFMNNVSAEGHAEVIPQDQLQHEEGKVWYLPHHGVYHPHKKTLRVVFDCASTFAGISLNKELLQGPDLTNTLLGVLLRFRQGPIALMTDIKRMFHQVRVAEEDHNYLRFLWWPDGDITKDLTEHRMMVHIFGAVSSPSCATYALLKTADDNQNLYPEEVINTIRQNFYVDDCLKSVHSVEQAISLYRQLTEVCAKGGFRLNKWVCNHRSVLSEIPEENRAKAVKTLDLGRDQLPMEKTLGVQWDVEQDVFTFSIMEKHKPMTRRGILSTVSSIYDPLGFLAPVILTAKQILQHLCKMKLGWDDAIPVETAQTWQRWLDDLVLLNTFSISRCFTSKGFGEITVAQLHHFCDASEAGFGAVSYLRLSNSKKEVRVAFVIGKARVAPLKQVTIPRLELAAAVLAVRLDKMLSAQLQLDLSESVFWSDSMTVLKYIANTTTRFKTFVANRVSIIRTLSKVTQWRHIGTKLNPADAASRGMRIGPFLRSQTWTSGPDFLTKPQCQWPAVMDEACTHLNADSEVKGEILSCAVTLKQEMCPTTKLLMYFSSWTKLRRAVAWILKLKERLKQQTKEKQKIKNIACGKLIGAKQENKWAPKLSVEDLSLAEEAIVRFVQRRYYEDEMAALSSGVVRRSSHLYKLDPVVVDGVMRVGGRLSKSALPEEVKHPTILPKTSHISKLILQHIHEKVGHGGRNHMLSTLRRHYWIPHANSAARKVIRECMTCQRQRQKPGEQKMSDLPADRLSVDLPPFTHVGIDYFGPIGVKRGRSVVKRYGVIFTCLTCRAIHLEVAHSLDTDSCINAIRRFICRRGQVKEIRSDNGTNLVSSNRELKQAIAELNQSKIHNSLTQNGIKWIFNPPHGAHHGGVWERLVQEVKKVLRSVLKQQVLDDEGLHTVLCEAEAILNDRPITPSSNDPNDLEALTPNHLLQLKAKPILPPGLFRKGDLYIRRRWRQVQYIVDLFWKRWVREYLPMLQERQKWNKVQRNFAVGDLVLIIDDSAPRNSWPTGRVTEAMADSKGFVRRVRVRTQTNELEKPINKICFLMEAV